MYLLLQFFLLEYDPEEEEGGQSGGGMAMLVRAMEREEREEGASLMEQASPCTRTSLALHWQYPLDGWFKLRVDSRESGCHCP